MRATAAATKEAGKLVRQLCRPFDLCMPSMATANGRWCFFASCEHAQNRSYCLPALPTLPALQSEAHKAQLAAAQQASATLQADLAALQAQHAAACTAKSELVKEKTQLEKRVRSWLGARLMRSCTVEGRRHQLCPTVCLCRTWKDQSSQLCRPLPCVPFLQLSIEENIRKQLKQDVAEAEEALAAARSEAAAAAEAHAAELTGLREQLAAREAAAADIEGTVAQMRDDIARLDALNAELKTAMDTKVSVLDGQSMACRLLTSLKAELMHTARFALSWLLTCHAPFPRRFPS